MSAKKNPGPTGSLSEGKPGEVETVPSRLFRDPRGRVRYYNIVGPSMRPTLRPGDLLRVAPYEEARIRPGDVIVFTPPGEDRLITHRLVRIGPDGMRARGDNNSRPDPWSLSGRNVIGRVTHVQRGARFRPLASGPIGRVHGAMMRGLNGARHRLFLLVRPAYRWASTRGMFRFFRPPGLEPRLISIRRPAGREFQLVLGRRVIGRLAPGARRWWIRPPFRLFIDEARLPSSGDAPGGPGRAEDPPARSSR
jgi:signal peptidase I